jgi:hypothetical protein
MNCRVKPGNDAVNFLAAVFSASRSHGAVDPRNLDPVADPADAQDLLSLADG